MNRPAKRPVTVAAEATLAEPGDLQHVLGRAVWAHQVRKVRGWLLRDVFDPAIRPLLDARRGEYRTPEGVRAIVDPERRWVCYPVHDILAGLLRRADRVDMVAKYDRIVHGQLPDAEPGSYLRI